MGNQFTNIWEVTPETAHPRARQLLADSVVWNYGDEDSPLGNDKGADTFASYLAFRAAQPRAPVLRFIHDELASSKIADADWDLLDSAGLQIALDADNGFSVLRRDDFILGLAFAQLLVEGGVDAEVRRRALLALHRQATDVVLSFRGGGGEDGRKGQLTEFQRILETAC
jgi:uncharacterized protein YfeS